MGALEGVGTGIFTIVILFLVVLAILWFLLPFAVFGTKDILREILYTQGRILEELQRVNGAKEESQTGLRAKGEDPGH